MKHNHGRRRRWVLVGVSLLFIGLVLRSMPSSKAETVTIDWAHPTIGALKQVTDGPSLTQSSELQLQNNIDCTNITYRMVSETTMQSGCFVNTAFGMIDPDKGRVIFNGTTEAEQVKGSGNEGLVPVPGSIELASLGGFPIKGSYMRFYTYFPTAFNRQLDSQLHPYLQMNGRQNFSLNDPGGQPIAIEPQSVSYSGNNSWLLAESPWRSFIRVNLATFDIMPFAPSFSLQPYDYVDHASHTTISDSGQYAAIESNEFKSLKVYNLGGCVGSVQQTLQPLSCGSFDYWPFISQHITGLKSISHVRFINESLLSFTAVLDNGDSAVYELAPTNTITNLIDYLGLGDSYTSGEGSFNYRTGTDTNINHCHLSAHSYPLLISNELFNETSGHSVACSGATISDLGNTSLLYAGQAADHSSTQKRQQDGTREQILATYIPGYIAQWEFAKRYQPRIITASVGGNDVGFSDVLQRCVAPSFRQPTCYSTVEDREELMSTVDAALPRLVSLYHQLAINDPSATLYVIGYPQIIATGGSCAANVHLNNDERVFAQNIIDYLNAIIWQAAHNAGVEYIDISQALAGHRLCETNSSNIAVNGLTAGTDAGVVGIRFLGKESYHPNALGQELIEQMILAQTKNFASAQIKPPPQPDKSVIQKGSIPSGRAVKTVTPDRVADSDLLIKGKSYNVTVDGAKNGLKPNSSYVITLRSNPSIAIPTSSDNNGNIDSTLPIPSNQQSGYDDVEVDGSNQNDQPVSVIEPVQVTDPPDGSGGNNADSGCPAGFSSGQDIDHDGIDDGCDAVIGQPPGDSSGTTGPPEPTIPLGPGDSSNTPNDAGPIGPSLQGDTTNLSMQQTSGQSTLTSKPNGPGEVLVRAARSGYKNYQAMHGVLGERVTKSQSAKKLQRGQSVPRSRLPSLLTIPLVREILLLFLAALLLLLIFWLPLRRRKSVSHHKHYSHI